MKLFAVPLLGWLLLAAPSAAMAQESRPQPHVLELKTSDGTLLKATYFAAAKPGPGVLLLHQSNRTRQSWDDLAGQLAAAGINVLAIDMRGHGDSGGPTSNRRTNAGDVDIAFQYLVSQPEVKRDVIGVAGAGWLGVD